MEKRAGKVFLDYNQNVRGKTLASIYSPRPSPQASVSIPLKWDELGKVYPTDFTILNVPERLSKVGDLWANIMKYKIDIVKQFSGMPRKARKSMLYLTRWQVVILPFIFVLPEYVAVAADESNLKKHRRDAALDLKDLWQIVSSKHRSDYSVHR